MNTCLCDFCVNDLSFPPLKAQMSTRETCHFFFLFFLPFFYKIVWFCADAGVQWMRTGFSDSLEFASRWLQLSGKNKRQRAEGRTRTPPIFLCASGSRAHRLHCRHQRILWSERKYGSLHPSASHIASDLHRAAWFPLHIKVAVSYLQMLNPSTYGSGPDIGGFFGLAEGSTPAEDAHLVALDLNGNNPWKAFLE